MHIEQIPLPPISPNLPPATQKLRQIVRDHYLDPTIKYLHKINVLKNVRSIADISTTEIVALGGGYMGASWWLDVPGEEIVLKFQRRGCDEEAEWLRVYREHGVNVPEVKAVGEAPAQFFLGKPKNKIKFLAMEAVKGPNNKRAMTAREIDASLIPSKKISENMGSQLAKILKCTSKKKFGNYNNTGEEDHVFSTWSEYLKTYLIPPHTKPFAVSDAKWIKVIRKLDMINFPDEGVYGHGDFSFHNVLVRTLDPLNIVIIDPSLVIEDPYFDLSKQFSFDKLRQAKRAAFSEGGNYIAEWWEQSPIDIPSLLDAYFKAVGSTEIDLTRLQANQLIYEIQAYNGRMEFLKGPRAPGHEKSIESDLKVRRDSIKNIVQQLTDT